MCIPGRLSKVRGSWFLEATDFCHPQARQIHRCIFAPVTSVNAHYYSVLTTPFDMVNAHYVIIDFRAKFFIKIQNQASDTSRSLPSFSSAPFLLRAVPSERLGHVYIPGCIPCKVYAEDMPILTIDSIVIYQTHAEDLRRRLLKMHPGVHISIFSVFIYWAKF